jgi:hypothetical protein
MSAADPYTALRELVRDPLAFRVLKSYIERRRIDRETTLERAIEIVTGRVRSGELSLLVAEASKPDPVWREERALHEVIKRAVAPFAGHAPSPSTLESIRLVVEEACVKRYPRHARRYVRKVVREAVGHTLDRLEIRGAVIVAALAGFRPN